MIAQLAMNLAVNHNVMRFEPQNWQQMWQLNEIRQFLHRSDVLRAIFLNPAPGDPEHCIISLLPPAPSPPPGTPDPAHEGLHNQLMSGVKLCRLVGLPGTGSGNTGSACAMD